MSLANNIFFRVGCAPIQEPTKINISGITVTVDNGYLFVLKLFEDGKFRFKTEWYVDKTESEQPDFKKNTQLIIQEHKKVLIESFKQTRIRLS